MYKDYSAWEGDQGTCWLEVKPSLEARALATLGAQPQCHAGLGAPLNSPWGYVSRENSSLTLSLTQSND